MISINRLSIVAAALGLLTAGASAQYIPSELLREANAGEKTVRKLIQDTPGMSASVGQNGGVSYGDQVAGRTFMSSGEMTIDLQSFWSEAGLANKHRIGYYNVEDPTNINWILGNVEGSQVKTWKGNIDGVFGLALDNSIGNIFYSDPTLNSDSALVSSNAFKNGFDQRNHVAVLQNREDSSELILSWEDLMNAGDVQTGGTLDFNDYGMTISNAQAVPEPGTMLALGVGAALALRRRKNKKA